MSSAPSPMNSDSMSFQSILALTGCLNTNAKVFMCFFFTGKQYYYMVLYSSACNVPSLVED